MTTLQPTSARPHGRSEVVEALVDAATQLFAAKGPAAVSLRDIAREADVNLGLIHRYIGGQRDLLAEVLARRPGMPVLRATKSPSPEDLIDLLLTLIAADAAYTKILLRATLDGFEVPQMSIAFPILERSAVSTREHLPRRDADVRVAVLTVMAIGWQALGPLLLEVLDQADLGHDELRRTLRPALLAVLTADVPD